MPRKNSLTHADFVRAGKAAFRRERGACFILSYGALSEGGSRDPQIACIVSKKTAARAVDRNLIKRRCRAAARNLLAEIKNPLTFIFYANKNAKSASFAEIRQDVENLMQKAIRVA